MSNTVNTVEKLGLSILHVGINANGAEDADRQQAFGFRYWWSLWILA